MSDAPSDATSPPRLSRYRTLRGRKTATTTTTTTTTAPASPARPSVATTTTVPPSPADTARLLAEQKRKDLERLQRELDQHEARRQQQQQQQQQQGRTSEGGERGAMSASQELPSPPRGLFGRRRGASVTGAQPTTVADVPAVPAVPAVPKLLTDVPAVPSLLSAPATTSSAAAAAAYPPRHIPVRWRQHTATVPITPDTTVADVLFQCADLFGPRAVGDPEACALVESYARIGLERRLRRYERVRDVVDSWDSDGENRLVVVTEGEGEGEGEQGVGRNGHAPDLTLAAVPRTPPAPAVVLLPLYHSQKPGRWTKRYLTLVPQTGQLVASAKQKDQGVLAMLQAAEEGKDATTVPPPSSSSVLLHLSDYDIGTPTPAHTRKRLRPPAMTVCFAVRSQHRSTMFVSTDNYVHMFAAADPAHARLFYDAVFAWRSWYLVHRKLGLAAATTDRGGAVEGVQVPTVPAVPLLPMKTVGGPKNTPLGRSLSTRQPDRPDGVRRPERRPTYDERTHRHPRSDDDDDDDDDIPLGLQFPQFQRQQQQQQQQQQKEQRPPKTPTTGHTSRPLTQARSPPARSPPAAHHAHHHTHHSHHTHHLPPRIPPAPLIDLTPAFQEPPQWSRDKRGRGVRAPPGTALVDLARGPLDAFGPAATATATAGSAAHPLVVVSRRTQTMTATGSGGGAAAAAAAAALATAPLVPRSQSQGPQAQVVAQRLAHRAREEYR